MGSEGAVPVKVFLVDDQQLVRAGFRMVIESQPDMEVVGEAGDGDEAVHALAATSADVVLMDVRMPVLDGVAATRRLRQRAQAQIGRASCRDRVGRSGGGGGRKSRG